MRNMDHSVTSLIFFLCVLCVTTQTKCYRILAIVSTPSYSHQIPYRRLWLELHERGHEIVLVTTNPIPGIKSPNFTQIDISKSFATLRTTNFVQQMLEGQTWTNFVMNEMFDLSKNFARYVFEAPEMKMIYASDSNAKFDVFLTELIYVPGLYAFAYRFNVPVIGTDAKFSLKNCIVSIVTEIETREGHSDRLSELNLTEWLVPNPVSMQLFFDKAHLDIYQSRCVIDYICIHFSRSSMKRLSSMGVTSFIEHVLGGLVLPSHESTWEMQWNTGSNLPFTKRLSNFVTIWRLIYYMYHDLFPAHQKLAESYLGPLPPLLDIVKNTSVYFVDQSDVFTSARPKLANMITFTSFHIEENLDPLPKDLQEFVDGADAGFIYFSLGSNARSADLPMELRRMFCDVFAKLPYRVVWKFETELDEKPANVYTGKWFSQQAILAHPNIKLFIMQGGLQSTEETIHFGVPTIVFPVLCDQDCQATKMDALGIGKHLEIGTVTKEEFRNTVVEIITNKDYKKRMMRFRNLTKDTPYDLVKYLAWWTEYVVRSDGAPHLRSSLTRQPWYQYCDMDIVVFLTIVTILIVSNTLSLVAKLIVYSYKRLRSTGEAVHYTVPVLGSPVLSDQEFQLKMLKSHGVANRLDLETLTKDQLEATIREMMSNKE
ncbi:Ecdysteroid UDP-glucosyltransferase [Eufriesea mexicana]|uniref:Ecdysteroid UDP-glucosyltransferase n=1 Tax=Eufriesea mexicana TaxID=516756 RepID=A0A310SIQ0_9HYME|nr:Ecdysteroid UDP-glucosyltransferase [Eufriesea mexicana]